MLPPPLLCPFFTPCSCLFRIVAVVSWRAGEKKLSDFSESLANYESKENTSGLLVPGQFQGLREPRDEELVKVASFGKYVTVMSSKQRPKKITLYGSDQKEYHFLFKGGEDLRQDQRISEVGPTTLVNGLPRSFVCLVWE